MRLLPLAALSPALAAVQYISTTMPPASTPSDTGTSTISIYTTDPGGSKYIVPYIQKFTLLYSTFYTPKSGTIGLGTINGDLDPTRGLAGPRSSAELADPAVTPTAASEGVSSALAT